MKQECKVEYTKLNKSLSQKHSSRSNVKNRGFCSCNYGIKTQTVTQLLPLNQTHNFYSPIWVSIFIRVSLFLLIWSICIRKTTFIFALIKSYGIRSIFFSFVIWTKLIHKFKFMCLTKSESECTKSRVPEF